MLRAVRVPCASEHRAQTIPAWREAAASALLSEGALQCDGRSSPRSGPRLWSSSSLSRTGAGVQCMGWGLTARTPAAKPVLGRMRPCGVELESRLPWGLWDNLERPLNRPVATSLLEVGTDWVLHFQLARDMPLG